MPDAAELKYQALALEMLVIFDALHHKGALTYLEVQEAIARCREGLPRDPYFDEVLNILERKYHAGSNVPVWQQQQKPPPEQP